MQFASQEETCTALFVTARWLPELIRRFEIGVTDTGLMINEKLSTRQGDGAVVPVLVVGSRQGWRLEMHLRNAFEDFLLVDREEKPPHVDRRLLDQVLAESKLSDILAGRLAIISAIAGSRTADDVRKKLEQSARHSEWLRI